MKVSFKGDGHHTETTAFGQTFPQGEWVEVEGVAAEKLSENPMFEAKGAVKAASKAEEPKADGDASGAAQVEIPADWETLPFMTQRALARRLDPGLPKTAGKEEVNAAIQAQISLRAS